MAESRSHLLSIRKVQSSDLPEVIEAARQTWKATYAHILSPHIIEAILRQEYCLADLERRLYSPTHALYVAVWDADVVGYAGFHRTGRNSVADLTQLYIQPGFQRRGIGGRLLTAGAADMDGTEVSDIRTLVAKANTPAVRFYRRHGFLERRDYVTILDDQMVELVEMSAPLSRISPQQRSGEGRASY